MNNKRRISRIAGLLYLVVVITGMFSLAYTPKQLFDWNDPAGTFTNIVNKEFLFRLSIVSSMICYTAFTFLPIALYYLLRSVNDFYAKVMAILALLSVPISFLNLQNKYAVLDLVAASKNTQASSTEVQQQVMQYLHLYDNGIFVATVFWGLWLLPLGYLIYKSKFLPRILGVFLMLGCLVYLVNYIGNTLSPDYAATGIPGYLRLIPAIGEIGTCLWLLLVGAKEKANN